MTQQSQIHATIAGRLYTFTLTASTDTPAGEAVPKDVRDVLDYAPVAMQRGLWLEFNAKVQLVQGPIEVPEAALNLKTMNVIRSGGGVLGQVKAATLADGVRRATEMGFKCSFYVEIAT